MNPRSWRTDHRPWSPPRSPWILYMQWRDLTFLHWPLRPEVLEPHLPPALTLDTFEGKAWLGISPFEMRDVRARATPALPRISRFPELNVRTYASAGGKPGVWFMSLDAASGLAVRAARWIFGLPYFRARMAVGRDGEQIHYRSERNDPTAGARFSATSAPAGPVGYARPGSLEHWLTERYCLYAMRGGRLCRAEIHHEPWPLRDARVHIDSNTMADPLGVELSGDPPLVHMAGRLDVVGWMIRPIGER